MDGESYRGKTVLVVGAARSGVAAAEFLLSRGARVILTDTNAFEGMTDRLDQLQKLASGGNLVLEFGGHRAESFRSCDFVVLSPGVPATLAYLEESRKAGIPILAEVELAYRHLKGKLLGITGSNGKTTTTTLVVELLRGSGLRCHAAGNIGKPLISFVAGSTPEDIYATELSSFQLESIHRLHPAVASILNISPNHLDRYSSFEAYIAAKRRIFMNQNESDFAVVNADNRHTALMAADIPSTPVLFSRLAEVERGTFVRGGLLLYRDAKGEQELLAASDIRLKGAHNLENVLAATTIALLAGGVPESMRRVVRDFRGVEHRLEWVADIGGVQFFNDSKATSVDATVKSIEAFPGDIQLILGGRDKAGDFTVLRPLVRQKVKHVILIGEAAGKIREALEGASEIAEAATLPAAVQLCHRLASPGDVVLLAPACASFDMFKDYEHRGRVFKEAVHALQSKK
jgi:UDP-N-acetylmuramoylalanine--D-glutamate ligase